MAKTFNWAFIGAGAIANTVAKEITKYGYHKIKKVYSRTYLRAKEFATKFNSQVCTNFAEAIKDVDAVYLATPHSCHYEEICACIQNGVPVLSEKAFTINAKEVESIISKNRTSYVSEGMWTRYNPITQKIKDIVLSHQLGDSIEVNASFCYPRCFSNFSDRVVKREYGGGALLDIGVYLVSYMQMLFGSPKTIECSAKFNKFGTDNSDKIILTYDNGTICRLTCSLGKVSLCGATLKGSKGKIYLPLFYRPTDAYIKINGKRAHLTCKAGYIHQFDAVAREINEGKLESSYIPLSDSLEVMRILDNIRNNIGLHYDDSIENI